MIRILIADDHELVLSGLRCILEAHSNFTVVAEGCDGKDAITKAIQTQPDVAVLDYSMPRTNGLEATREIRARLPKTEVLVFSIHVEESLIGELLRAGARGYVLKTDLNSQVVDAIEALALHKPFFSAYVVNTLLDSFLGRPILAGKRLGDKDRSLVQLIADGCTNKEAAHVLGVSLKAVESQRASLMRKLKLSSSADIVRYAIRNGLVAP